jgi:sigma-B regulation protein RsbU (phosphoserine phosphatase)
MFSGHGLAAAMLAVNLQAAFHLAFEELSLTGEFEHDGTTLSPVARRINRLICRNTADDKFITATLGIVSPTRRQIALVNAGHHPPLVVGDEVHPLNADSDLLFGIEEEMDYQVQSFQLASSEQQLLFYTDGLIEAANPAGELLGREAVVANLALRRPTTDEHLLQSVVEHVRQHLAGRENDDDMTLLTINFDTTPTVSK